MPQQPLDPHMWEIDKLFDSKIYNVPVYQRPYSWNSDNVDTLLEDIFHAYNSPDKNDGYYTGNLLLHDNNVKINGMATVYEVIDGQQRITTIILLLLALFSISTIRNGKEDDTYRDLKKYIWKKITKRSPEKEYKAVNLNSTEKKCFDDLFNYGFDHPEELFTYSKTYETKSISEKFVMDNFIKIYDYLMKKFSNEEADEVLDFSKYVLENVRFIAIECRCSVSKVFSMFESINSKGKKLDEIDLIKTYIFSELDEDSYNEYLGKWGDLIIKTENNLYDYFYTYIRAFITFYRQNIKILNFKSMSEGILKKYFEKDNLCDTFKSLIDDMVNKVNYYIMLSSPDKALALINNKRFRFYYKVFNGTYIHPKPLFMRVFVEFDEGKISKNDAIDIVEEVVKYMIKFTNIADLPSKNVITLFSNIMGFIYENKGINKDMIFAQIANESLLKLDDKTITLRLGTMDAYEKNKKISTALLALYESISINDNGKVLISYDKAYVLVEKFTEAFSLDHLLVQTPESTDDNYKYYCKKKNNSEELVLKEGHDFPDNIKDGMPYDMFKKMILNKLGNLRIYYQDKNSGRQNTAIDLKEYGAFHTYADIIARENVLIKTLVETVLKAPKADLALVQKKIKSDTDLPNMEKLIDLGLVNIGDELYITTNPAASKAKLIDTNKVEYNSEAMTLNQWGCKVTGWTSIRIYAYACIVGETETLHDKRLKYIEDENF